MRRLLFLIFMAVVLVGCKPDEQLKAQHGMPIFFTTAGVGQEFIEIGTVTGDYKGKCYGNNMLTNRAYDQMVAQARSIGADAVLLPQSVNKAGEIGAIVQNCDWVANPIVSICCLLGIPIAFGKRGEARVTGVAIRYKDKETSEAPPS